MKVEAPWKGILGELQQSESQEIIYVFGVPDSGKSSFCRFLLENLSGDFRTAYIDCDPGQSVIGPPTTLGLKCKFRNGDDIQVLHFVGAASPPGHLLQMVVGIKKLTQKALQLGMQKIILDSSGFVLGAPAREFQFQTLDVLQPRHICALQTSNELETLLVNFGNNPAIKIHRLPVSGAVVSRDLNQRRIYREQRFTEYFQETEPQHLSIKNIGFHGMIPDLKNPAQCQNRLIALCNRDNFVMTLGIVRPPNMNEQILYFDAPPVDLDRVASVQFGSIYLKSTGVEINPGGGYT